MENTFTASGQSSPQAYTFSSKPVREIGVYRCRICEALWRFNEPTQGQPDGSWSVLTPAFVGKCCDNEVMGAQIEPYQPAVKAPPTNPYTEPFLALRDVRDYTQHIVGRIKTLIDASVADTTQRKAMKDVIHQAVWNDSYDRVRNYCEREFDMIGSPHIQVFPFDGGPRPQSDADLLGDHRNDK